MSKAIIQLVVGKRSFQDFGSIATSLLHSIVGSKQRSLLLRSNYFNKVFRDAQFKKLFLTVWL